MFQQFFSSENFLFRGCAKLFDLVVLSALWLALCIPILTAGPATAALYYTTVKCIRRGEADPYRNFFHSFRDNFKVGAVTSLITAAAGLLLWLGWLILCSALPTDSGAALMRSAYSVALLIPLGVLCYLFPLLSRFSFRVGGLFGTALKLSMKHLPSTVVLVLLQVELIQLCLAYWYPLFFVPSLAALLNSFFLERIFKCYTPQPATAPETVATSTRPSINDAPPDVTDEPDLPWYLK